MQPFLAELGMVSEALITKKNKRKRKKKAYKM